MHRCIAASLHRRGGFLRPLAKPKIRCCRSTSSEITAYCEESPVSPFCPHRIGRADVCILLASALFSCVLPQAASGGLVTFLGRAPINFTSSIPGINKHDVFYFDLTIDDSVVDTDHRVFPNGPGGVTALGEFPNAVRFFRIYAYPLNTGGYDPVNVTYDYSNTMIRTVDAGPGPGSTFHNEHVQIYARVTPESMAAGARYEFIMLNLYNGTSYSPYSEDQQILDTSASGLPMSLADLFFDGTSALERFEGVRPAQSVAGADGVFMEGLFGSGTLASGDGVTVVAVPEPILSPLATVGILFLAYKKRRHRRSKSPCR
jgi:hypothetical protein